MSRCCDLLKFPRCHRGIPAGRASITLYAKRHRAAGASSSACYCTRLPDSAIQPILPGFHTVMIAGKLLFTCWRCCPSRVYRGGNVRMTPVAYDTSSLRSIDSASSTPLQSPAGPRANRLPGSDEWKQTNGVPVCWQRPLGRSMNLRQDLVNNWKRLSAAAMATTAAFFLWLYTADQHSLRIAINSTPPYHSSYRDYEFFDIHSDILRSLNVWEKQLIMCIV